MRSRVLALCLVAAGVIVAIAVFMRGGDKPKPQPAKPTVAKIEVQRGMETSQVGVSFDDDPAGSLRLEGQVIDGADRPVAHAVVVIDANPPREARTEDDGSFAFDGLTPRTYRVAARAGDDTAAPVSVRVTQKTEPIILRVRSLGAIAITVTGDDGKPIKGALVELRDLVAVTVATDDAGKVTVRGVSAGWHVLKASAEGHAAAYREVATTAEPNATYRADFVLRAGASVAGTVVDGTGAPIEGARVLPEHLGHVDDFYDERFDAVLTDAKGRWRLTGLPRETTRIRAFHGEYAPGASLPLVLSEAEPTNITIVLERGTKIVGRVVDRANAPVPGAEVRISVEAILNGRVRRVSANANGEFAMAGLPRRLVYVMAASEDATSPTLTLDLAKDPKPLELRLDRDTVLAGIVVTTSGTPVAEARVVAERTHEDNPNEMLETQLRGTDGAIAGTDGRFSIGGLSPGTYLVRAIRPGSPSDLLQARLGVPTETGKDARIVVDDLSSITGKIVHSDGKPVDRFAIRLGLAPLRWFSDGSFVVDDVPAGKQYMQVSGVDFVPLRLAEVEVTAGKPTDLGTLTVQTGRTIAGSVVDKSGHAIAGARVVLAREIRADGTTLVPYPDGNLVETVTRADGRFELRGVGATMQQIAAEHDSSGRSVMTTVQAGATDAALTLTLLQPGIVQGFVRQDGKPTEALIVLRSQGAADSRVTVRSGADGSYRFDRVAPDRYNHIAVRMGGGRYESSDGKVQRVDVAPGATVNVDVDLTDAGGDVVLKIGSPTVEFGYGVIGIVDDPNATSIPLPKTMSEGRAFGTKLTKFQIREGLIVANKQIKFEKVPAGHHVACIAPLRADPADPAIMAELQRSAADWPLYCKWVDLTSAPNQQVTVDVQPPPPPAP